MGYQVPSPLEVLLQTMTGHWLGGRLGEAVALATAAAPWVHVKPVARKEVGGAFSTWGDDELDELCKSGSEGAESAAQR